MAVIIFSGIHDVLTYEAADGIVTAYTPPDEIREDEKDRLGQIEYTYNAHGIEYKGTCPPEYSFSMPRQKYKQLSKPHEKGETITIYFDPQNPAISTIEPRIEATAFMFIIFVIPFWMLGWLILLKPRTLTPKEVSNNGMTMTGGRPGFLIYFILSAVSSFAFGFLTIKYLSWQTASLIGAMLSTIIIPGTAWLLQRWVYNVRVHRRWNKPKDKAKEVTRLESVAHRKELLIWIFVSLFWCGISGIFVTGIATTWIHHFKAKNYIKTDGVILKSVITSSTDSDGHTSYRVKARYQYKVNEKEYISDKITLDRINFGRSQKSASNQLSLYPQGKTVAVFYNPNKPEEAVLNRHITKEIRLASIFMIPFIIIGIFMIIKTIRAAITCAKDSSARRYLR